MFGFIYKLLRRLGEETVSDTPSPVGTVEVEYFDVWRRKVEIREPGRVAMICPLQDTLKRAIIHRKPRLRLTGKQSIDELY